jgi:hypothetical protein
MKDILGWIGFRRVESSQTPARGPQFGPDVHQRVSLVCQISKFCVGFLFLDLNLVTKSAIRFILL